MQQGTRFKIHSSIVPLGIGIGFVAGNIIALSFSWILSSFFFICIAMGLIILSILISSYPRIVFSLLSGLLLGLSRAGAIVRDQNIAATLVGRDFIFSATVSEKPEFKKNQTYLKIRSIQYNYTTNIINSQAYVILSGEHKSINRSDIITFRGSPQPGFGNYVFSIYHPQLIAVSKPSPPDYALIIRDHFVWNTRRWLGDNDSSNLALGFLMGEKSLSNRLKERLKIVGLSHVVVASGFVCLSL